MYFPKACTSGTVQGSGFISYGADVELEFCDVLTGRAVQSVGEGCPIPSFALVSIGFGNDGAELNNGYKYDALVVPIPDIAMPEPLFHFLNTKIGARFKDGAYHVGCSIDTTLRLRIAFNDNHFFVTVPYLVDKVDSGCVLRMRPLLATENFCETACGWGTECAANSIILGLPFLHSYCLSYDRGAMHGNIVLYEQRDPPKRSSICHYTNLTTATVPSSMTTTTTSTKWRTQSSATTSAAQTPYNIEGRGSGPSTVLIVAGSALAALVAFLVLGVCWWCRRRSESRRRLIKKMSKKGDTSLRQRHNEYVAEESTRRDKWHLLPIELDVLLTLKLGSGAFADVYKGRLLRQGLEVAMKVARDSSHEA
ncbi:hypothetical protein AAVH_40355, partial [Aphelenchoides avenae]